MPHYGFNFQWIFSFDGKPPEPPDERALDFMARFGLNFARIPCDYRFWTREFDYFHPDESVFAFLDRYLEACRQRGIHMSLNLHRAPGYCVNGSDLEKHNLWRDKEAQDGFVFQWETFVRRYKGVPGDALSFNLINEPPAVRLFGLTRKRHAAIITRAVEAIRAIDPARDIVIDGLGGGHIAMPELADLGVTHSGRGYQPMPVSHWGATWWDGWKAAEGPTYPGVKWERKRWNKDTLRKFYAPWRDVEAKGARIHIGEFGCYNQTPNDVALRWFADLFSLYHEFGWGYALWMFDGAFGIVAHGRPGAQYETLHGYKVDHPLFDLFLAGRV
jgi:endoglucanase